ncbi:MAG: dTDP-4-dehydrorhamnose 3,5-epimerase family protein [candidate division Zixibacteria bacterium]|nr:dTDP-4-dehydrorhamnose 3,5-epimerase family protein [candidate division Zixibacteria bacterium]
MIDGVEIKNLKMIPDERGTLMEILRSDDHLFEKFGQVYVTTVYPGVVKAWHGHKLQTDFFTVVSGMIKMVLCDLRESSSSNGEIFEMFIGQDNPALIRIPPGVFHGIKCIGTGLAIALNVPTEPYNHANPDEERLPWNTDQIKYDWDINLS